MPAKIVFADGSKEMAHNLDDLRERWILKRQEEDHRLKPKFAPIELSWVEPNNLREAYEFKGMMNLRQVQTNQERETNDKEIALTLAAIESKLDYSQDMYAALKIRRERLTLESLYEKTALDLLQARINHFIRGEIAQINRETDQKLSDMSARYKSLERETDRWKKLFKRARNRIKVLESLLRKNGIAYIAFKENEELNTIQDAD